MALGLSALAAASASAAPGAVSVVIRRVEFPTSSPAVDPSAKAVLSYPEVTSISDAALRQKVNDLIGPKAALGSSVAELRDSFSSGEYPFDEASARVVFSGRGILQVAWTVTATGAYTSVSRTILDVDVQTGTSLGPRQMFADPQKLAGYLDSRMHPTAVARIKAVMDANPDASDVLQDAADNAAFTTDMLASAEIGEQGIRFQLDFDFPHAYAALEPDPVRVRLSWKELRPFLSSGSALQRFEGKAEN